METAADVRKRSITISVLVHLALFLGLYFLVLTIKIPPFGEAGGGGSVLVNIGYVDLASGEVQPLSENVSPEPQPVKEKITRTQETEKILTQETEEAPAVVSTKKPEPKKTEPKKTTPVVTETKTPVKAEPKVDSRAIYKGKTNSSTSQGTSNTGTGDQGDPTGDPNSLYTGKGSGTGTGPGTGPGRGPGPGGHGFDFDLRGRNLLRKPQLHDTSQETGKVEVEIVVDKQGNVTSTSIGRKSTTTNSHLQQLALKAARETKFSPSPTGQEIQRGTITFVFVVH